MAGWGGLSPTCPGLAFRCCDLSPTWSKTVMHNTNAKSFKLTVKMTGEWCVVKQKSVIFETLKSESTSFPGPCWGRLQHSQQAPLSTLYALGFGRCLREPSPLPAVNAYHFNHCFQCLMVGWPVNMLQLSLKILICAVWQKECWLNEY